MVMVRLRVVMVMVGLRVRVSTRTLALGCPRRPGCSGTSLGGKRSGPSGFQELESR